VVAVKAPNAVVCLVSALTFHRAVDKRGKSIGLLLRSDRGMDAAQEFFLKARAVNRFRWPTIVNLDGNAASHRALRLLGDEDPQ
jgi:transposase-like protein